jgi:hypothetical protein
MPRPLGGAAGERMELPAYYADFQRDYARAREFWKLERGQVFAEPGDPSWEAFDSGDWDESIRLIEDRREWLVRRYQETGIVSRRIRIVSLPVTPYLQWELNFLKVRDESGNPIRILLDTDVADIEDQGPLPEISTIDRDIMYQVAYDDQGVLEHALRYTDAALVSRCRDFIAGLYARGEQIGDFFAREIAHLPPARPAGHAIPGDYLEQAGRLAPPRS